MIGGFLFSLWTGAILVLDTIGRAETLADLAKNHNDLVKWLISTPPVLPGLGALALAVVLCYLLLTQPQPQQAHAAAQIVPVVKPPVVVARPAPVSAKPSTQERVFVNLTADEIVKPFHDHTNLAARRLFEIYKGKWFRVEGAVANVSPYSDREVYVVLQTQPPNSTMISLYFDKPWFSRVEVLTRGSKIKAIGVITRGGSGTLGLDHCELE